MKDRIGIVTVLVLALIAPLEALAAESAASSQRIVASQKKAPVKCDVVTGSRVQRVKAEECGQSVRAVSVYSREELERTGRLNMANALRELNPGYR